MAEVRIVVRTSDGRTLNFLEEEPGVSYAEEQSLAEPTPRLVPTGEHPDEQAIRLISRAAQRAELSIRYRG